MTSVVFHIKRPKRRNEIGPLLGIDLAVVALPRENATPQMAAHVFTGILFGHLK